MLTDPSGQHPALAIVGAISFAVPGLLYPSAANAPGAAGPCGPATVGPSEFGPYAAIAGGAIGAYVIGKAFGALLGRLGAGAAGSAEVAGASGSGELVPLASKTLGEWGETRLSNFLGGQGVKPSSPFKTPFGPRYPDRLVDGVSFESKAGLNVQLTSSIEWQIAKDAWLINNNLVKGAEWHFWRGAQPALIQTLQNSGIKAVLH